MSLVGPRPFVVHESSQITGWASRRLDITPGITGLWQVLGRTDIPFDEMVKLDYIYVTNWSLLLGYEDPVPDDSGGPVAAGGVLAMNIFVVPAYDEEANLPRLLTDLEARPGLWSGGRVIVVDDGSRDATASVAGAHPGTAAGRGHQPRHQPGPGTGVRPRLQARARGGPRGRLRGDAGGRHHQRSRRARRHARAGPRRRRRGARLHARPRRRPLERRPGPARAVALGLLRHAAHQRRGRAHGVHLLPRLPRLDPAPGLRAPRRRRSSASTASPARRSCSSSLPASARGSRRCPW